MIVTPKANEPGAMYIPRRRNDEVQINAKNYDTRYLNAYMNAKGNNTPGLRFWPPLYRYAERDTRVKDIFSHRKLDQ
jgi:hypothetical protein